MIRTTTRKALRSRHCDTCCDRILPGAFYLEHVASPHHGDLGNSGWWRMAECSVCAVRCGRSHVLAMREAS